MPGQHLRLQRRRDYASGSSAGQRQHANVTASESDVYGNASASASASATQHSVLPDTPTVKITTDTNQDGVISAPELNGATNVAATVTLDATGQTDLTAGGTVHVTVVDAGTTTNLALHLSGSNLVDAGGNTYGYSGGVITLTEAAPGNGNTISVTASETDVYGNASASATASATQHSVLPDTPTVKITTDTNQDGVISAPELNGATSVAATVTLDATGQTDLTAGGTVHVTVVDAGTTTNLALHLSGSSLIDASGNTYGYSGGVITLSELAPGNGNTLSVTASETDVYGNVSASATASATQHSVLPDTPTVKITTDTNQDGVISAPELNGATNVAATVTLDATGQTDLTAGGTVHVTVVDAGTTTNLALHLSGSSLIDAGGNTYGYSGGVITLAEAAPGNGNTLNVSASETDVYGNVSASASASATQNSVAPDTPTVAITTDANHDGVINATELNGASTVTTTVTLDTAGQTVLTNGGSVQISVVDAGTTTNLNLHLSGSSLVDAGGNTYGYSGGVITLAEAAPGNGNALSVTASETDVYGNASASATASATQNSVAPDTPTVAITTDANHDGVINATELNGASTVTTTVTLDTAGQTVLTNGGSVQISGS